jgi:hypothetical protein
MLALYAEFSKYMDNIKTFDYGITCALSISDIPAHQRHAISGHMEKLPNTATIIELRPN